MLQVSNWKLAIELYWYTNILIILIILIIIFLYNNNRFHNKTNKQINFTSYKQTDIYAKFLWYERD